MADRKITDLTALAAGSQATGDFLTIVDVSEAAAVDKNKKITVESLFKGIPSNVGIGTTSPSTNLEINGGTNNNIVRIVSTDANANIEFADNTTTSGCQIGANGDNLKFGISGSEAMRLDSSGRLLVGTSSARTNFFNSTVTAPFQIEGAGTSDRGISVVSSAIETGRGGMLVLAHQKSGAVGGNTILSSGDQVGLITFQGSDGSEFVPAARIAAEVDGTPGSNDMPGRLVFSTTADGASSASERLRIDSSGNVGIGESSPDTTLHIDSSGATTTLKISSNTESSIDFEDKGGSAKQYKIGTNISSNDGQFEIKDLTANAERMRIDSSGRLLVGTSTAPSSTNTLLAVHCPISSSSAGAIQISQNTSGANKAAASLGIVVQNGGESTNAADLTFNTASGGSLSERMRIDSSGRLLVGTTTEGYSSADDLTLATSGHTGITVRSGSSSDGNIFFSRGTSGNDELKGYIQYNHASDFMRFATAHTERMRIDSSGNVGIGTTSPGRQLQINGDSDTQIRVVASAGGAAGIQFGDTADTVRGSVNYDVSDNSLQLRGYNNTERMRIDIAGNVGIGDTSPGGKLDIGFNSSSVVGLVLSNAGTGTSARFYSGSSIVGSITVTSSATAFNTSSDYRLKENVVDIADGITRVKQLAPKRFNFIVDADTTVDGFLAHEAQTVVPEAVTGEKDGEEMQGIDQSKLIPLLTAALQEAIAKIETLETKVAALEAG